MEALNAPLVACATVTSRMPGPRTPVTGPWWTFAAVAGDRRPSNDPVIESFSPTNVAVAEPIPAMLSRVFASTGTGDSRTLYVSGACAVSARANAIIRTSGALMMGQYTTASGVVALTVALLSRKKSPKKWGQRNEIVSVSPVGSV